MINYRKGKERYKPNELGSLYVNTSALDDNERPIIYIGGQMEYRLHIFEQTGITMDPGHNMFTGSWFYDYPIHSYDKSKINAEAFAQNFIKSLDLANLHEIDVITSSFGGIIAALASKDKRVHKIYAIHPPITGTPLANPSEMEKYKKLFTRYEKLLLKIIKRVVNTDYGFLRDSYNGVDLRKVDLNKLIVIGSSLDSTKENGIALGLYNMIKTMTNLENDGVVVFDEKKFNKLGINYIKEETPTNHFNSCTEEAFYNAYSLSKMMK